MDTYSMPTGPAVASPPDSMEKTAAPLPQWIRNVIISSRPSGWNGLYILGCYDRRVTMFHQQARALNVVRALSEVGDVQAGHTVAVIGAGAAGVTAAVAAARLGCKVTLYDERDAILALMAPAQHRYVHPHIYDWPAPGSDNPQAGLPFMDWRADYADRVVTRLRAEFARHRQELGERLNFAGASVITHIRQKRGEQRVQVLGNDALINHSFHLVLLASGFGVETTGPSYWGGDDINGPFSSKKKILVSGSGDGGLIDVARAAMRSEPGGSHFRHDQAIQTLSSDQAFRALGEAMALVDAKANQRKLCGHDGVNLFAEYAKLASDSRLLERIASLRRSDTEVIFNYADEAVFSTNSALINRMLVLLLLRAGIVTPKFGRIASIGQSPDDGSKRRVGFEGEARAMDVDLVFPRHGPPADHLGTRFPMLKDARRELGGKLAELSLTERLSPATIAWYRQAR